MPLKKDSTVHGVFAELEDEVRERYNAAVEADRRHSANTKSKAEAPSEQQVRAIIADVVLRKGDAVVRQAVCDELYDDLMAAKK